MSAVMKAVPYVDDLYDQLEALPENLTGEIINGRLYTQPRPTTLHALAESGLAMDIGGAYHRGRSGFIDLLWRRVLLVEHKSRGKDLDRALQQALDYFPGLKERDLPRYVLVSDFARFRLYDLDESQPHEFPRSYWIARISETRSGVYPDHRALVEPARLTDF